MFALTLLGENGTFFGPGGPSSAMSGMVAESIHGSGLWEALALTASHFVSFVRHFLIRSEYRRTTVAPQMFAPCGRRLVLHLAILGGPFAIRILGSPVVLLLRSIMGKIAVDLGLHFWWHRRAFG